MIFRILYSDGQGRTDGVTHEQLMAHLPQSSSGIPLVLSVCHGGFIFNHDLNSIRGQKWIHVDMTEWGWGWDFSKTNVIGASECYPCTAPDRHGWGTFAQFVSENPPALTFQRELRQADVTPNRVPIDFLAMNPIPPTQSKNEYDARPILCSSVWGYSHPTRTRVHGDWFHAMGNKGITVYDSWEQVNHGVEGRAVVSIYTPHYLRKPIKRVMDLQSRSKVSLALPGCGFKAFKDAESCVGSLPAFIREDIARAFPWDDANSIQLTGGMETFALLAMDEGFFYDIYVASQENARRYERGHYIANWIMPNCERVL